MEKPSPVWKFGSGHVRQGDRIPVLLVVGQGTQKVAGIEFVEQGSE
jgi:hypothetical protein